MGKCTIDHSLEDVFKKLESQQEYLTDDLHGKLASLLNSGLSQEMLNEIFHLLKKYDLVDDKERNRRNEIIKWL